MFNRRGGSGHASVASKTHKCRTRRRHEVLGKGGGHHHHPLRWHQQQTRLLEGDRQATRQPPCHRRAGLFSCRAAFPQKLTHWHKLGPDQAGCSGTHTNIEHWAQPQTQAWGHPKPSRSGEEWPTCSEWLWATRSLELGFCFSLTHAQFLLSYPLLFKCMLSSLNYFYWSHMLQLWQLNWVILSKLTEK